MVLTYRFNDRLAHQNIARNYWTARRGEPYTSRRTVDAEDRSKPQRRPTPRPARIGAEVTIKRLRAEIIAIERTFPELRLPQRRRAVRRSLQKAATRTRRVSAAARKAVSTRMKTGLGGATEGLATVVDSTNALVSCIRVQRHVT